MAGTGVIGVKGNGNVIVPINNLMKSTKELTLTVTSAQGGWSLTRAKGIFYADSAGVWRLRFNVAGAFSQSSTVNFSISNITTIATRQAVALYMEEVSVATRINSGSFIEGSSGTVYGATPSANSTFITVSGDIELASEPTTYTTSANMENVANIAAYIPNMCPTITRLLSGTAQTYTTPAGVRWLKVRMIGGGGGGGGSSDTNVAGAGGTGGTTSFGTSLLTAVGGSGGPGEVGIGGAGGTVTVNSPAISMVALAGVRAPGNPNNVSNQQVQNGAASPFAGGAIGAYGGAGGGAGLGNSGTGGGGGGIVIGYRGAGGGAGGYIEAIVKDPSATYTYSVGAGGTAGAAGSNGYVGGVGGSGVIIIEEHYI